MKDFLDDDELELEATGRTEDVFDLATVRLEGLGPAATDAGAALVNVRVKYRTSSNVQTDTIIVACNGGFEGLSRGKSGSSAALRSLGCAMITSTDASRTVVEARFALLNGGKFCLAKGDFVREIVCEAVGVRSAASATPAPSSSMSLASLVLSSTRLSRKSY